MSVISQSDCRSGKGEEGNSKIYFLEREKKETLRAPNFLNYAITLLLTAMSDTAVLQLTTMLQCSPQFDFQDFFEFVIMGAFIRIYKNMIGE